MRTSLKVIFFLLFFTQLAFSQFEYTHQDSLRGSITPERAWWDLVYYHLTIKVDPADSTMNGSNLIKYKVLNSNQIMQIDLQSPMQIKSVIQNGDTLEFASDGFAHFVKLEDTQSPGDLNTIEVFFGGKPRVARLPPWSSGLVWKKDSNDNDFVATTCQGDGASLWWPCKDHMYDEVDSMLMSITVPDHLTDVSNGMLRGIDVNEDQTKTFHWFVSNPINNYGVNVNIANYTHFSDVYKGEGGNLQCDYYVLPHNLDKAKMQFKQVHKMLDAFEHWFGPYPFYEDGFKLVEVPYLGMEHQSSVTYGNKFKNGYLGSDLSNSGWGLKFDFIIIHESGHEWFANSITYKDIADMWIHEGFTAYSESLYLDYHYGKQASSEYVTGTRNKIQNDIPIIGPYNVNQEGSGDMYCKGANLLNMIRYVIDDDDKWRDILRSMNKQFYHQTVSTAQIENFINEKTETALAPIFDAYLRDNRIPKLQYAYLGKKFRYKYINCHENFSMPLKVELDGEEQWIHPNTTWQTKKIKNKIYEISIDPNFYINLEKLVE